ncbi:MAG: HlyC/CorC family transporter [Planctomycetes bacterium]|nr:HlyC/CorC family transporter [Planctomycetota bacterium]
MAACLGLPALALESPAPPVEAAVSFYYFAITVGGALLAALGSIAAASLLGYSRTLLADELEKEFAGDAGRPPRERVHAEVARLDTEYLAVALFYTVAGWIIGLWALRLAVAAELYVTALVAFGALMLLVAGSLPVAIAHHRAERTLLIVRPAVRAGWFALRWPLVMPLLGLTRLCLLAMRLRRTEPNDTAEVQKQVMAAVADSTATSLEGEERAWIGNIVALKELQVSTIMTPRPDIIAFEQGTPMRTVVDVALEHGFSRYPVYRERIDDVVGLFYVKDALALLRDGATDDMTVRPMMRETLYVPESMGAAQLLRRFQAGNQHMAIVLDEYGTTAGIVSVEDVLEQIVGELADEYDDEPGTEEGGDEQVKVVEPGRVVEIPARASIEDVNELLGSELPEEGDWETIAGLVIAHCNRIPHVEEVVAIGGVEFVILDADERRLKRLRLTQLEPHAAEAQAAQAPPQST